jgi:hypothetical protein
MFLGTTYQNGKNIPNNRKTYQMAVNIPNGRKYNKWPLNIPASSIASPSKIYPNQESGFENMKSGNPGHDQYIQFAKLSH